MIRLTARTRSTAVGALGVLLVALLLLACAGAAPAQAPSAPTNEFARPGEGDASGYGGAPNQPAASPGPDQQLIVYTGTLDLQVDEVEAAIGQADQLVGGLGGHVASSSRSGTGTGQRAAVTYRIPAEKWNEALAGLRAIGLKVLAETTKSEDVTGQVVDLDARIANARASEAALQSIMDRAGTIDEVLAVQRELTSVRGDIESMTAERELLANRAALATLEVTFETQVVETQVASGSWDVARTIDDAVAALVRITQWLATLTIWTLIVLVPVLVPLLIVVLVVVRVRRRWTRNHPRPQLPVAPVGPASM